VVKQVNSVNHLRRLQFSALVYSDKSVERRGGCIYVIQGPAYPSFKQILVTRNAEASEEMWDRSVMEALANSSGTEDEVLRFTELYGPLNARLKAGEKRNTHFKINDWRKLQRVYRDTWDGLVPRRGKIRIPTVSLPVIAGEEFGWWFNDLSFKAGNLYRLLLLELYSMPKGMLKKCTVATCRTPYFVAEHRSQRYCATCKTEVRLESKRKWWSRKMMDRHAG